MARPIAVLFAALLVCSCATTEVPYRELRAGDGRPKDAAVIALQVVIEATDLGFGKWWTTNSGDSEGTHPILHLLLEDGEGYRTLDIPLSMTRQDWELRDGRYRFSRIVTAKVPLGTYLLKALELFLGVTPAASSSTIWYLLWYPRVGFEVAEPGVYTLGSLFLDMAVKSGTSWEDLNVASRMSFDQGAEATHSLAQAIAERDPSLATDPRPLAARYAYALWTPQFRDDVLDRWREDELWPKTSTDAFESGFEGRKFFFNKRISDDRIDWIRPVAEQQLPERYDIGWDARLLNGEPGKLYGLMLGRDERNAYVFAASGDGAVMVLQVVDGVWQKRPLGPVPSAAHAMAGGEANRFLVSVRGKRVEFSVNGEVLGRFVSPFELSPAFLAPCLESRGVLTIERFRITEAR